ncbi:TIGR04024 family LLM class F420-dependent oxidoreductase [Natrarchaeobius halalkaliphilus]|uniref:TIGR04024 family LLM class F420-dependent oxidoreductase n=1 Tax=Natrarchaeobius halalkaliphilus TaxID=1679091 RepID=A0A3N6LPC7_9EURY|nr:TIGR04024 family LLM class F420-dependent oxidoreductase [Natrarchaeobius halalkaliphilus]RQG91303.1 TIGR04024 family LLM class F420-dependent oxidoreductase [Natrarchaeobius halalkaliphilus]
MTDREIHLPVAAQPSVDSLVEYARRAESAGYGCVSLPETWGRDAVTVLATIAERTDSIDLGSSILNTYSRTPALLGQTAATLQEVSNGRFRLGIGPSGPAVVENWHGVAYGNPLKRTRETVEVVRQVLSGEPVEYDGESVSVSGFRLRCEPPEPVPPIEVTGMGPKAVELAGRFADGWHGIMLTPDGVRSRLEDVERGTDLGERDADDVRVTVGVTCCALSDGDRARALARQHAGFYVGGMGTFYRDSLVRQGYAEAETIHDAWQEGDRTRALDALDDDLLDELCAAGDPKTARETLRRFEGIDGVDAVTVSFPRGAEADEIRETMDELAPDRG